MASNSSSDQMRFNVGGKIFETTAATLAVAGQDSFFGTLVNGNWNVQLNREDAIFIDRDPKCFSVLLNLLRTGELHVPSNVPKDLLRKEAQFYGVWDLVRAATWHPLDGNRLLLSTTVTIPTEEIPTVIRASPTGGCCVAHGRTIRVYDWTLIEQSPIILDYESVKDIAWIDLDNIVVAAPDGMELFNVSTGEQTLEITQEEYSEFSFCSLCVDNDHKIYSGCYRKGIGVWDGERSEPIDFFHQPADELSKVQKLQWLPGRKSLLVGSYNSLPSYGDDIDCLTLLDFRQKKKVWGWSGAGSCVSDGIKLLQDMVMMESKNTIFFVDEWEKLGFTDLRFNPGRLHGFDDRISKRGGFSNYNDYGKGTLIEHEGQLFYSKDDRISVYSGSSELYLTSTIHTKNTCHPIINDLSIANDRLFSLRKEVRFDVWETTPRSPIL